MEGRVILECGECDRRTEIAGELPHEYTRAFDDAVHREGWVPRPGRPDILVCADCLGRFAGHESVDDEEKVQGRRNPMEP